MSPRPQFEPMKYSILSLPLTKISSFLHLVTKSIAKWLNVTRSSDESLKERLILRLRCQRMSRKLKRTCLSQ